VPVGRRYAVTVAGRERVVEVEETEAGWRVAVDGQERRITPLTAGGWIEGTRVVPASVEGTPPKVTVILRAATVGAEVAAARVAIAGNERAAAAGPASVRAPIPGRVVRLLVKAGDVVAAGAGLVVLEAMKMENEIRAPGAGTVSEVRCTEGAAVEGGQVLVMLA